MGEGGVVRGGEGGPLPALFRGGLGGPGARGPAGDDAQPTWTLELAEHGRLVEHIVHGEVPCMRVLYDALQKYTSARFDAVVDALPRPDVEGLVVPRREADDNGDDGP